MPLFGKKKKGESKDKENKRTKDNTSPKMPLFRRQSEKCRKRQQDQELLAQQDPEPRFDVSSCELKVVPSGVYEICKVLRKQVLLLHDNWLSSVSGGGELSDLSALKVLDLHNNEIKSLPDDIGCLTSIEVLNLANNKIKALPESFSKLTSLQTLNLKHNRLKELPEPICDLRHLRTLDVSSNEVYELPAGLCHIRALETLVLDTDKMRYPHKEICEKTTAAVMMFLCGAACVDYVHPSKYWLKVQAADQGLKSSVSEGYLSASQCESEMNEGYSAYQTLQDQKRKDAEDIERALQAEQEIHAQLAVQAADDNRKLISKFAEDETQIHKDLLDSISRREKEQEEILKYLTEAENGSLVSQLLDYNAKAKETEKLLEEMETARMKEDDWFTVRWEEFENIRKQDVLDAMKVMLTEYSNMEQGFLNFEMDKDNTRQDALELEMLNQGQMESHMYHKEAEQKKLVANLEEQEALQKAAFEALIFSQDYAHSRIRSQISLIEKELAQLTALEIESRDKRMEDEFNMLAEQRIALSVMLSQLFEEQDQRQAELKLRLIEMEQQREDGQADYWLVQYQRLLDWKPQAVIDRESNLEIAVKDILTSAGAEQYIPVFARHRITIETLVTLTDADLSQMGVHELGLRKAILKCIDLQDLKVKSGEEKVREKLQEPQLLPLEVEPSAPSAAEAGVAASLLERQASITARGVNSECSVCLDNQSNIIFLPCGHVCCCSACAQSLSECPLCRAEIKVKVKLSMA